MSNNCGCNQPNTKQNTRRVVIRGDNARDQLPLHQTRAVKVAEQIQSSLPTRSVNLENRINNPNVIRRTIQSNQSNQANQTNQTIVITDSNTNNQFTMQLIRNAIRVGNTVAVDNSAEQMITTVIPQTSTINIIDPNAPAFARKKLMIKPSRIKQQNVSAPLVNSVPAVPNSLVSLALVDMPNVRRSTRKRISV